MSWVWQVTEPNFYISIAGLSSHPYACIASTLSQNFSYLFCCFLKIVILFMYMSVFLCLCAAHGFSTQGEEKRESYPLGLGGHEPQCMSWELNLGPLEM